MSHLIIVSGTRYNDIAAKHKEFIYRKLDAILDSRTGTQSVFVAHGACGVDSSSTSRAYKGVDSLAQQWARFWNLPTLAVPARWEMVGKVAGGERNTSLAILGAILKKHGWQVSVAAFPAELSLGTLDMISKAEAYKLECKAWYLEDL